MSTAIYDIPVSKITGEDTSLAEFKGKVLLVVNVASKCGLTPQYEALESLYEQFRGQGLVIAGFPANNFKSQEPGTNEEIQSFCTSNYGVRFPMFSKIEVNGDDRHPLGRKPGERVDVVDHVLAADDQLAGAGALLRGEDPAADQLRGVVAGQ